MEQCVVVTGAARGIGKAVAARLLADGGRGRPGPTSAGGGRPRRPAAPERVVEGAVAALGGLDVLVNCAGIYPVTPVDALSAEDIDRVLAVNVRAVLSSCASWKG